MVIRARRQSNINKAMLTKMILKRISQNRGQLKAASLNRIRFVRVFCDVLPLRRRFIVRIAALKDVFKDVPFWRLRAANDKSCAELPVPKVKQNFTQDKGGQKSCIPKRGLCISGDDIIQHIPFEELQNNRKHGADEYKNQSPYKIGAGVFLIFFHIYPLCTDEIEGLYGFFFYRNLEGKPIFHHGRTPPFFEITT